MAELASALGASDTVVKGWLAKALTVSRGPQWVCDNCHHLHADWAPVCENCESFDTLAWTTPATAELATPTGVQMLPLIGGLIQRGVETRAQIDRDVNEIADFAHRVDVVQILDVKALQQKWRFNMTKHQQTL